MKKLILSLTLFLVFFSVTSQEKERKHELKLNILTTLFTIPEIGYDYILNNDSSVGIDVLFTWNKYVGPDLYFALTPHYRYFFGNKRAAGFFLEGWSSLRANPKEYNSYALILGEPYQEFSNDLDVALGISIGGKYLLKKDFVLETFFGGGPNLIHPEYNSLALRFGVTLGKRF